MRAGRLDAEILVQASSESTLDSGQVLQTWHTFARLRAQVLQNSAQEFMRAFGASSESVVVFKTRHHAGISLDDRVIYQGEPFDILELKQIGRRKGLELRCKKVGQP